MSAVSNRRNVKSVNSAPLLGAAAGGVILTGTLIAGALKLLCSGARSAYKALSTPLPTVNTIPAPAHIRSSELPAPLAATHELSRLDAEKVAALLEARSVPLSASAAPLVERHLGDLISAGVLANAQLSRARLADVLREAHSTVFRDSIALVCRNTVLKMGFEPLDTGMPYVVAGSDGAGRSLVTEIRLEKDGSTSVSTEVTGVTDGSCQALLDRWDLLVEGEGLRSQPPSREHTGGVLQLDAARLFVMRKLKPAVRAQTVSPATVPGGARRERRVQTASSAAKSRCT
jgi:hypothetical protein